jgi:hypothetical protein
MKEEIEDLMFPDKDKLKDNNGFLTAQIVDAELDPINCSFKNDGCVELDTRSLQFVVLTHENLEILKDLIIDAEMHYNNKKDE